MPRPTIPTIQARPVLSTRAALGEGSLWDDQAARLYWLDIFNHQVFVYNPATQQNQVFEVRDYPSTIVPMQSGGVAITVRDGFVHLDLDTGSVTSLATVGSQPKDNRFNDGKCDPSGRFWAGTMQFEAMAGKGALYRMDTNRTVTRILDGISCSNGLVWTADRQTMYYIDSMTQEVHSFDYNDATGEITNRHAVVSIPKETGLPDGMTIDTDGKLWVALFGGAAVHRYDPATGDLLEYVEVPGAKLVTSCAFGGTDLCDLYITTASCEYEEEDWQKYSEAGSLFVATTCHRGLPVNRYAG